MKKSTTTKDNLLAIGHGEMMSLMKDLSGKIPKNTENFENKRTKNKDGEMETQSHLTTKGSKLVAAAYSTLIKSSGKQLIFGKMLFNKPGEAREENDKIIEEFFFTKHAKESMSVPQSMITLHHVLAKLS